MKKLKNCTTLLLLLVTIAAKAQYGVLDNTFAIAGKLAGTTFALNSPQFHACVQDANGKYLFLATQFKSGLGDFIYISRYNNNGTLDLSFGTNGINNLVPYVASGGLSTAGRSIKLQSDGKIVVAFKQRVLARYKTNGTVDSTFGNTGFGYTLLPLWGTLINDMIILPNDKIIIAGLDEGQYDWASAYRLTSNGIIDSTFGIDGGFTLKNQTSFNSSSFKSIALQASGELVFTGNSFNFSTIDSVGLLVARLTSNGILDNSFNTNGYVRWNKGMVNFGKDIEIQSNGKIVVVGNFGSNITSSYQSVFLRYNTNGTLDNSFNFTGESIFTNATNTVRLNQVELQNDGGIIGIGENSYANSSALFIKLKADGLPDNAFGSNGQLNLPPNFLDFTICEDGLLDNSGKILFIGWLTNTATGNFEYLAYRVTNGPTSASIGVGTTNINSNKNIEVYPSPSSDYISIKANKLDFLKPNIEIVNTIGKVVYRNNEITKIDVSNFVAGLYFIKIYDDNKNYYLGKFIKK